MPEGEAFHERFTDSERQVLSTLEFAICVGRFYEDLAERLLNGAAEGFALAGVSEASVHEYPVPGAFELPQAAKLCAESGRFAGVACLGAVDPRRDQPLRLRARRRRAASRMSRCKPGSRALGFSPATPPWSRRWRAPAATSATQACGAALTVARMALLARELA
jgi:hypothetical protein